MKENKQIDWNKLKEDFFSSEVRSVREFLRIKKIKYSGAVQTRTKGWSKEREAYKSDLFELVKELEKKELAEAVSNSGKKIQELSVKMLNKIEKALEELETYMVKKVTKTKEIEYDYDCEKKLPKKEVIREEEEYEKYKSGIINTKALRDLTNALKELKEINYSNVGLNNNKVGDENENNTGVVILPEIDEIDEDNSEELKKVES